MTPQKMRRFLTVSEFADLLGVHQNTIYRAIKRRDLDGVSRIPSGRSIRIDVPVALASMRKELPRAFHHM
jgi:excisionase family DNA binding protein